MKLKVSRCAWIIVCSVVFLLVIRTLRNPPDSTGVKSITIGFAFLCAVCSQICSAYLWTMVVSNKSTYRADFFDYILVQPGKYVPTGVLHYLGLYSRYVQRDQTRTAETFTHASLFTAYTAIVRPAPVTAGLAITILLLTGASTSGRLIGLTVTSGLILMLGEWFLARHKSSERDVAEGKLAQFRFHLHQALVQPASNPRSRNGVSLAVALLNGLGFTVLAGNMEHGAIYVLAVAIGLLAVPFPAGLGVRETAFVFLVGSGFDPGLVHLLVLYRFLHVISEVFLTSVVFCALALTRLRISRYRGV